MKFTKVDKIVWSCLAIGFVIVIIGMAHTAITQRIQVDTRAIVGILFIPVLLVLIALYDKFIRKKRGGNGKGGIRRGWTEQEKEDVRHRQGGVCAKCGKSPPRWEYHHRNGNRGDNSLSNCQALCPNCHSVKTHG